MFNKIKDFLKKAVFKTSAADTTVAFPDTAYSGASQTSRKLKNWITTRGSADADLLGSRETLISRSRDAYRNSPLAHAIITRLADYAIGPGLKIQIKIDSLGLKIGPRVAMEIERQLEFRFKKWSDNCDYTESQDFGGIQYLILVTMLSSGDLGVNTVVDDDVLKIQTIEADQICNPSFASDSYNIRGGIEVDPCGKPIAYYVMSQHPGDTYPNYTWEKIMARGEQTGVKRFFHIMKKERPLQHRGVPILAPVLESLRTLDRYSDAELTAAVIASYFTIFVKKRDGQRMGTEDEVTGEQQILLAPGLVVPLLPEEDIVVANPSRPNSNYQSFVVSVFQQVCAGIGLPAEFVLQSFNSSYSASRAAIMEAWKTINLYRKIIVNQFCNPMFELWLASIGVPKEYRQYIKASWVGPTKGSLDEQKEIAAAGERIRLLLSTRQKECEELVGEDWNEVVEQLAREEDFLKQHRLSQEDSQENNNTINPNDKKEGVNDEEASTV